MSRHVIALVLGCLVLGLALPAVGVGATVDTLEDFGTNVAVAEADNPIGFELMDAHCDFLKRVERPDGSAEETATCRIVGPHEHFGGELPDSAFSLSGGACLWASDYWTHQTGELIIASSFSQLVTPSGQVHITADYAADPLTPEDCGA